MRVLFTTFAATAHLRLQAPLAWALRNHGHEVVVASQPDLASDIADAGLTAVSVGERFDFQAGMADLGATTGYDAKAGPSAAEVGLDMSETRPEKLTWDYVLKVFSAMTAMSFQNNCPVAMVDDLVEFARHWRPDLVIWDPLTFGGGVAARACGAAHARLLFGPDLVGRMREVFRRLLGRRPAELRDDPLAEWLTWTARRCGVDLDESADFDERLVTGQFTIDPMPPAMRLPVDLPSVPLRYVPYHGRAAAPGWTRARPQRKRVCLTLGVSHREVRGGDEIAVEDLLDAVADLDAEVVATLDASQLGSARPPGNVRVVDYVPLDVLLPSCAAIVHHGGSGTFATAIAHGVPQVIVPDMLWDSPHKAAALRRCGAGLVAGGDSPLSAEVLRRQIARVLDDPSFVANAGRLRRQAMAAPSPNELVPALERLACQGRSGALTPRNEVA